MRQNRFDNRAYRERGNMIEFFQDIPGVLAVMSLREDGSMKLFGESDQNVGNRSMFFEKIGISGGKIIAAEIVHGTRVETVDASSAEFILEGDGLITNDAGVFLSVTVADCVPVYMYESERGIAGVVHCGWRGIVDGIIGNAIQEILRIGGKPGNLRIALGPGINPCHFEVQNDVLGRCVDYPESVVRREGKVFVDLKHIIREQLIERGVNPLNIENNASCTMESDRYFSFRRDRPDRIEAMVAVIGMTGNRNDR